MERVLRGSSDNRTAEQISQDVEDSFSYDSIKQFKDEEMRVTEKGKYLRYYEVF